MSIYNPILLYHIPCISSIMPWTAFCSLISLMTLKRVLCSPPFHATHYACQNKIETASTVSILGHIVYIFSVSLFEVKRKKNQWRLPNGTNKVFTFHLLWNDTLELNHFAFWWKIAVQSLHWRISKKKQREAKKYAAFTANEPMQMNNKNICLLKFSTLIITTSINVLQIWYFTVYTWFDFDF